MLYLEEAAAVLLVQVVAVNLGLITLWWCPKRLGINGIDWPIEIDGLDGWKNAHFPKQGQFAMV
jgi:hypothetical protein